MARSKVLIAQAAQAHQTGLSANGSFASFEGNPDFLLSLARGLKVIEAFEGHTGGLSSAELSRRTGLSRASVRRILMTLELLGYAVSDGRCYQLEPRVMRLGFSYLSSSSLTGLAQPVLEHVAELVHEWSSLAVLDQDQVVYIARSTARRLMSVGLSVGSRLPAFCTSLGRVLLTRLSEQELQDYLSRVGLKKFTPKTIVDKASLTDVIRRVRLNGFALVDEELELGLRSIAVPIKTRDGRMLAAMNIGVYSPRVSVAQMTKCFLPILREHSQTLGQLLR